MFIENIMIHLAKGMKVAPLTCLCWLSVITLTVSCGTNDSKIPYVVTVSDSSQVVTQKEPVNYNELDYSLPQSGYHVKIKITSISTKISKKAFITRADQYSVPEKADGYFLILTFSITSPYDHELMVPVPDYFYITSENGEWFSASTTWHKQCHCEIDNSTDVMTLQGKRLYEISEEKCGYDNYCVKFKAQETKEFKIKFTDAILGSVRKLVFNGFNIGWNNPSYTVKQDKGLIVDVDARKIVGEELF